MCTGQARLLWQGRFKRPKGMIWLKNREVVSYRSSCKAVQCYQLSHVGVVRVTEDAMDLQVQLVHQAKKVTRVLRDPKATLDLLDLLGYVNTIYIYLLGYVSTIYIYLLGYVNAIYKTRFIGIEA